MKTLNLFGSESLRQVLGSLEEFTLKEVVVSVSPMSLYMVKQSRIVGCSDFACFDCNCVAGSAELFLDCLKQDINQEAADHFLAPGADFLVLDLVSLCLPLVRFGPSGVATCSELVRNNLEGFTELFGTFRMIEPEVFPKGSVAECVQWLCRKILKVYEGQRIILVEEYLPVTFVGKDGTRSHLDPVTATRNLRLNELLLEAYTVCRKLLKGAVRVSFPDNVSSASTGVSVLPPFATPYSHYLKRALGALLLSDSGRSAEEQIKELGAQCSMDFESLPWKPVEVTQGEPLSVAEVRLLERLPAQYLTLVGNTDDWQQTGCGYSLTFLPRRYSVERRAYLALGCDLIKGADYCIELCLSQTGGDGLIPVYLYEPARDLQICLFPEVYGSATSGGIVRMRRRFRAPYSGPACFLFRSGSFTGPGTAVRIIHVKVARLIQGSEKSH